MFARIFTDLILLASVILLPWWFSPVIAIAATFYFRSYYEMIAAGFLVDMLYGVPDAGLFNIEFSGGIIAMVAYGLIQWFKKRVRTR